MPLLLASATIGVLLIVPPSLLEMPSVGLALAASIIVVVLEMEVGAVRFRASPRLKVCEPALTVTPVFRFTKTLMSPELPCAANACANSGVKCFHKADDLFCKATLHVIVSQYFNRLRIGIGRMDDEAAFRLALDVKRELQVLIFERQLQTRKLRAQAGENVSCIFFCNSSRVGASSTATLGSAGWAMDPPPGLGSMRYVKCEIRRLSSMGAIVTSSRRPDPHYLGTVFCKARSAGIAVHRWSICTRIGPTSVQFKGWL